MQLKYSYNLTDFKEAYKIYLSKIHPRWNKKTIESRVSDVFFLFRQYCEQEAWKLTITEGENAENLKEELTDLLSNRKDPEGDAQDYIHAILELQEFVRIVAYIEKAK